MRLLPETDFQFDYRTTNSSRNKNIYKRFAKKANKDN